MEEPTLLAVGSINMDVQIRTDRWPDEGETLLARDFLMTGGGKAANVALLARRLGRSARLFGHVGADILADEVLRSLDEAGVDLRGVKRVEGAATALSMIVVRPDGEKTIILAPNANDVWEEEDADAVAEAIGNAPDGSVLVVDLEVPENVVRRSVAAARRAAGDREFPVVLDPSPADRMPEDLFALVDVITPNPSEAETLTGITVGSADDAERAGRELLERGVGAACMKLPGGGCVVVADGVEERIDPLEMDVVDTTGAGDAFAGGLGVALLDGLGIVEAARFAVATSHVAVTAYGSQESYPTRDEVERMLVRLGDGGQAREGNHGSPQA